MSDSHANAWPPLPPTDAQREEAARHVSESKALGRTLAALEALDPEQITLIRRGMHELILLRDRTTALLALARELELWGGPVGESAPEALLSLAVCLRNAGKRIDSLEIGRRGLLAELSRRAATSV